MLVGRKQVVCSKPTVQNRKRRISALGLPPRSNAIRLSTKTYGSRISVWFPLKWKPCSEVDWYIQSITQNLRTMKEPSLADYWKRWWGGKKYKEVSIRSRTPKLLEGYDAKKWDKVCDLLDSQLRPMCKKLGAANSRNVVKFNKSSVTQLLPETCGWTNFFQRPWRNRKGAVQTKEGSRKWGELRLPSGCVSNKPRRKKYAAGKPSFLRYQYGHNYQATNVSQKPQGILSTLTPGCCVNLCPLSPAPMFGKSHGSPEWGI